MTSLFLLFFVLCHSSLIKYLILLTLAHLTSHQLLLYFCFLYCVTLLIKNFP